MDDVVTVQVESEIAPEYRQLLEQLEASAPPVSGKGFDYSKIRGTFRGRTAKAIVLHLSCQGWSVKQIGDEIGIPTTVIGKYLSEAIQEASPIEDVEVLRNWELRKLDVQEQSCWEQFERSCEDAITTEEGSSEKGGHSKTVRKGQSGNPAYIKALVEISKHRAKLLGLEAPKRLEVDKREQVLKVTQVVVRNREEAAAAEAAGLLK